MPFASWLWRCLLQARSLAVLHVFDRTCLPRPLQDAFGQQPARELLAQQGLDPHLQQLVLHGVLMQDHLPGNDSNPHSSDAVSSSSTGGGGAGGSGEAAATAAAGAAASDSAAAGQAHELSAADALERLRVYVQSAGRYGPDTGGTAQWPAVNICGLFAWSSANLLQLPGQP
jgi:hypothetical protein